VLSALEAVASALLSLASSAAKVRHPPLVSSYTSGPELPLQRSNDAAAQLSLSGRSFIVQHLDRFMGKKLHDVAN
jgi:hypothetical protein